jgi:L-malate glycosyltransferase
MVWPQSETDKIKILIIPAWFPIPEDPAHGIFVREHAQAVSIYCDVVILYSRSEKLPLPNLIKIISDQGEEGLRTVRISHRFFSVSVVNFVLYMISIWLGKRYLEKRGFKPDIIHAHEFMAGFPAIILKKWRNIPVVITEHWTGFPRRELNWFAKVRARIAFQNADAVCPVSQNLREHIEAYGIKARYHVIPNPVNTRLFYPDISKNANRTDHIKHILFVGRLHPNKGLQYLIKAMSEIIKNRRDFVLDIVGEGPNKIEYQELTKSMGLDNFIKFHGGKALLDVSDCMRRADFVVLPSEWENLPVVLLEAMACGKPIIASSVGGIPEIVEPRVGLLVKSKDVIELATAINHMLDNYLDYPMEVIGQLGRNKYSFETIADLYYKLYLEVISVECSNSIS